MKASIFWIILVVINTVYAQRYSTIPDIVKPQVPGSLGKYFVYVKCTDCEIDSELVVEEAERSATNKTMSKVNEVEEGKKKGNKCKGRDCPKRPQRPTPSSDIEEYENPHSFQDKQGSFAYAFIEDFESKPDYPFHKSPSDLRTEDYINPYVSEDDLDEGTWHEYPVTESSCKKDSNEKYNIPHISKNRKDSSEDSRHGYPCGGSPFKEDRAEVYVNPHSTGKEQEWLDFSWLDYLFPESPSKKDCVEEFAYPYQPEKAQESVDISWFDYFFPQYKPDSNRDQYIPNQYTPVYTEPPPKKDSDRGQGYTPVYTGSPPTKAQDEYFNPFLPKDKQHSDCDYDEDENPDLQYFKALIENKYENAVFRHADLQGKPNEKGMPEDNVFCVYETVKDAGKIRETLDYSLQKPCKIISSPANKVNMTTLFCRHYPKSRVCLMKVNCPPPSLLKSEANECVEQIIIRKQNINAEDEQNSEGRYKRQDPGYNSKAEAMGDEIDGSAETKE